MKVRPASFHAFLFFGVSLSSPSFQTLLSLLHRSFLSSDPNTHLSPYWFFLAADIARSNFLFHDNELRSSLHSNDTAWTSFSSSSPSRGYRYDWRFEKERKKKFTKHEYSSCDVYVTWRRGLTTGLPDRASHKSVSAEVISAESTARRGEDNLRYALRFERWKSGGWAREGKGRKVEREGERKLVPQ